MKEKSPAGQAMADAEQTRLENLSEQERQAEKTRDEMVSQLGSVSFSSPNAIASSYISPTANVEGGSVIGVGVGVGENTNVGPNTVLENNSSVGDNATLAAGSRIEGGTVREGATIGEDVVVESGALVDKDANVVSGRVGKGAQVGESATILDGVGPHAQVEPGTIATEYVPSVDPVQRAKEARASVGAVAGIGR